MFDTALNPLAASVARRLVPWGAAVAGLLIVCAFSPWTGAAQAQTVETLISNMGRPESNDDKARKTDSTMINSYH